MAYDMDALRFGFRDGKHERKSTKRHPLSGVFWLRLRLNYSENFPDFSSIFVANNEYFWIIMRKFRIILTFSG